MGLWDWSWVCYPSLSTLFICLNLTIDLCVCKKHTSCYTECVLCCWKKKRFCFLNLKIRRHDFLRKTLGVGQNVPNCPHNFSDCSTAFQPSFGFLRKQSSTPCSHAPRICRGCPCGKHPQGNQFLDPQCPYILFTNTDLLNRRLLANMSICYESSFSSPLSCSLLSCFIKQSLFKPWKISLW